jgi:ribosome-associated protein
MHRMQDNKRTPSELLAEFVVAALADLKAGNVKCLDVRHLTSMMEFMVIADGRSSRHVRALSEGLVERCKAAGYRPLGVEGADAGEWVLVDLDDVVVHIMLPRIREFYDLEKLWDISPRREARENRSAGK